MECCHNSQQSFFCHPQLNIIQIAEAAQQKNNIRCINKTLSLDFCIIGMMTFTSNINRVQAKSGLPELEMCFTLKARFHIQPNEMVQKQTQ